MRFTAARVLISRCLELVFRRRRDARLSDEIRAHLDELADDFVARGLSPADARIAARRAFGGVDQVTHAHREQRGLPLVDAFAQDLCFAARLLAKDRWFTATAACALALGLGSATTVFTIVKGMNLNELPVDESDRILYLQTQEARSGRQGGVSFADFLDWQRAARTFSGLAAFTGANVNVGDDTQNADRFTGTYLSANGFAVLRVRPILGRDFTPDDDRAGAGPVAILAFAVWRDRYGTDPSIVGRTIRVNGVPATVIGVMPDGFRFPVLADIWQPLALAPGLARDRRDARTLSVYGRLADGATLAAAGAELAAMASALSQQFPATNRDVAASAVPFTLRFSGRLTDPPPLLMMTAVSFVLLIACANAASLALAQSAHRTREVALRVAMGASRGRIVRQLLVESVMLASIAGLPGLLLSLAGVRLFTTETADFNLPYWMTFGPDARVFTFLAIVCLGTGIAFGLAPAWQLARMNAHDVLKEGSRGAVGSFHRRRWMSGLLVAELALTLTLLVGAGLLLRSSAVLSGADLVVDTANVLTARLTPPPGRFAAADDYRRFYAALEERLDANADVHAATIASALPFVGAPARQIVIDGDAVRLEPPRLVPTLAVGDRFFDVLRLPIVRGRSFGAGDDDPAQPAAIVNEHFVSQYFGGADPIGRRLRLSEAGASQAPGPWLTIVGVSRTVRHSQNGDAGPAVYLPLALQPPTTAAIIARGRPRGVALASALRSEILAIDTDVAMYNIVPLTRVSQQSRWIPRAMSTTLSLVAAIAFALSTMGLYGVTAYGVVQRTAEIGIRTALGAERSQVLWLVVRGMLPQLVTGLAIGLAGAAAVGQLLRGFLVQTSPLDPATFVSTMIGLIAAALAACVVPARRAVALDPIAALRHD